MRERLRETAREAILDAAEHVVLQAGLDGATAAAIATRAGVAVGTLYNYFSDRDDILASLFRTRRAELIPAIDRAADAAQKLAFEDRLRAYVREILSVFEDKQRFLRLAVLADEQGVRIGGRDKQLMTLLQKHLEQILREGGTRKRITTANIPLYVRMLHGAIRGVVLMRVAEGGSIAADADLIVDTFLHGVTR
ncbi:MAG: TetR/AcrR family transcriptional regulator [Kofleriaceae bacterium]